ncbi:cupin domain-containing protein [Rhodococcus sp. KBS0724]|uniref:cupin domain-containing protein n=1 Tax=Rhodococcus sp. KBS0724 TaxID=1179674 RepID=UPI00110EEA8F|nr:cupin domain-containing protein [Rhodococcus sp. KBS0724]TSD45360.1 cupin domain-containing protein [Rhodococcus sp. KBS0724]
MRKRHQILLALSAAIGLSLTPIAASATPSTGVHGEILGQVTFGDKDYVLRQITVDPGGSTGWHFHDGVLYAAVAAGTLSHYRSDCSVDGIYQTGSTLVEPSGSDHVHIGNNSQTTPLVLLVVYVNPTGSPLSEDAAAPNCQLPG